MTSNDDPKENQACRKIHAGGKPKREARPRRETVSGSRANGGVPIPNEKANRSRPAAPRRRRHDCAPRRPAGETTPSVVSSAVMFPSRWGWRWNRSEARTASTVTKFGHKDSRAVDGRLGDPAFEKSHSIYNARSDFLL